MPTTLRTGPNLLSAQGGQRREASCRQHPRVPGEPRRRAVPGLLGRAGQVPWQEGDACSSQCRQCRAASQPPAAEGELDPVALPLPVHPLASLPVVAWLQAP